MINPEHIHRVFSSPVFFFLFFTVFFGLPLEFLTGPQQPPSLIGVVLFGAPVGLVMTMLIMRRAKEFNESIGITDPKQLFVLQTALKTSVIPDDPHIRKILPAYLQKVYRQYRTSSKLSNVFWVAFLAGNFLLSVIQREVFGMGLWAIALIAGFATHRYMQKNIAKIERLYEQLGMRPDELDGVGLSRVPELKNPYGMNEAATPGAPALPIKNPSAVSMVMALVVAMALLLVLAFIGNTDQERMDTPASTSGSPASTAEHEENVVVDEPAPDTSQVTIGAQPSNSADTINTTGSLPAQGEITVGQPPASDTNSLQEEPMHAPVPQPYQAHEE